MGANPPRCALRDERFGAAVRAHGLTSPSAAPPRARRLPEGGRRREADGEHLLRRALHDLPDQRLRIAQGADLGHEIVA